MGQTTSKPTVSQVDDDFYTTSIEDSSEEAPSTLVPLGEKYKDIEIDDRQIFKIAASNTNFCPDGIIVTLGEDSVVCATKPTRSEVSTKIKKRLGAANLL
ncbi:unnamed protein product [Allacma fusca]|uniref:Uncharacterized protein n=1 Tax=Allacma fusca TaxID=39272 RepID=A0A8J2LA42_9HEXA|nr:unnamed protein product [Allacma fusca]